MPLPYFRFIALESYGHFSLSLGGCMHIVTFEESLPRKRKSPSQQQQTVNSGFLFPGCQVIKVPDVHVR